MGGITFCFLITRDLSKESVWEKWFLELKREGIEYRILTHCSNPDNIKSEWIKSTLVPKEYICATSWSFHTKATLSLYNYANLSTNSSWYSLHSESCVPIISVKKFVELYNLYKEKTIMQYSRIWWDPYKINRANLGMIDKEYHYSNQEWIILCKEDLSSICELSNKDANFKDILLSGPAADESLVSVFLKRINNFKNVICKYTTLVDWKRSPNGNNPYTFKDYNAEDKRIIEEFLKNNEMTMFMRKVDITFPDKVLLDLINL